jgi:hypothetical protein
MIINMKDREIPVYELYGHMMNEDKVREIDEKIADLKARWLAHFVPPSMWWQLEELEGELEKPEGAGSDCN